MKRLMTQTIPAHSATLTARAAQIESAIGQRFCVERKDVTAGERTSMSALETAGWGWGTR